MKKTILLIFPIALLIFISSCKKTPTACASADKSSVMTGDVIAFTSCSQNAQKISWDYGDGSTDEGNSVSHSYNKAGNYLVKMVAYSKKDKKWDKTSLLVTVSDPPPPAKRYLTKMVLKSVPDKKPNGDDWDNVFGSTSTADVYVLLKLTSGEFSKKTSYVNNVSSSDLPKTWDLAPDNIYLTNASWDVEIRDDDDGGIGITNELMNSWTINPATNSAANGVISLTYGSNPNYYALDIYFEER